MTLLQIALAVPLLGLCVLIARSASRLTNLPTVIKVLLALHSMLILLITVTVAFGTVGYLWGDQTLNGFVDALTIAVILLALLVALAPVTLVLSGYYFLNWRRSLPWRVGVALSFLLFVAVGISYLMAS